MVNPNKAWLPQGYEVPKSAGAYMKFEQGANKFRILTPPVMGWEYWTNDNKPVRLREQPKERPADMRLGKDSKIKHFWAFGVWNYNSGKLMILEVTQSGIQQAIADMVANEDWGDPQGYDITVNRKGEGLDSEYTVQPSPHKPQPNEATAALKETPLNLEALFAGDDPFKEGANMGIDDEMMVSTDEEIMAEANPFGQDLL